MKKMAELQITVVKDARNKQAIVTQVKNQIPNFHSVFSNINKIFAWEDNNYE